MSTDPSSPSDTDANATEADAAPETGTVGLKGNLSLGAATASLGRTAEDHGIQRPPSLSGDGSELPKVTVPPFSSSRTEEPRPADEPTIAPTDTEVDDVSETLDEEDDNPEEATRPPTSTLRFATPSDLYSNFPEVKTLTLHRPRDGETVGEFMDRLRGSTTPEEAITFTAFAAQPAMSIWWAYGCLRTMADSLSPEDRGLMEMIAMWSGNPDNTNRWRVMKAGLYAPKLTPVGYLALAVGWSGGTIAPNDPAPVPAWRTPKAVNTAILSSVAHISLQERSRSLSRFIDLAGKMFEVY